MRKLVNGVVEFRKLRKPDWKDTFARLALGQKPDSLFVACSDSRVAANVFASTEPGDLFVVRNVGNLIPLSSSQDASIGAALDFAVNTLRVKDIVICGHSECGAMQALLAGEHLKNSPVGRWLHQASGALDMLNSCVKLNGPMAPHNVLSQLNVLVQLHNLLSHPSVAQAVDSGRLGLHGWWFDIGGADVYAFDPDLGQFQILDEKEAASIEAHMGGHGEKPNPTHWLHSLCHGEEVETVD